MAKKVDLKAKMAGLQKSTTPIKKTETVSPDAVSKIHKAKKGQTQKSTIEFPKPLYRELKIMAMDKDMSLRALILEYLEQGLRRER